jgi:two-component system cell cycle response regulator
MMAIAGGTDSIGGQGFRIGFVASCPEAGTAGLVRPLLPPGCWLDEMTIAEATRAVAEGALLFIIVAVDGPDWMRDLALLTDLHAVGSRRPLAVFGLVPRADPLALVKAFELNVADVAGLPVQPEEVRARLGALVRRRMVALARAAETRAVKAMAVLDPVTGIHNRHHLDNFMPVAITQARNTGRPLSLLMIDLDALKPFNDRWGHAAGDRALRAVAEVLKREVRLCDTLARYGGDEIALVMPDAGPEDAAALAERLVAAVREVPVPLSGRQVHVTISIGVASLQPEDDHARLVDRADMALYAAKRAGRNQVAQAA